MHVFFLFLINIMIIRIDNAISMRNGNKIYNNYCSTCFRSARIVAKSSY
jgi:hypothetical protein